MTTTLHRVKAGCDATIEAHAAILTDQTLERRDVLPKAGNHKPMACSDPYAAHVRKDMMDGRATPWHRLLAVDLCDRRDGVPKELVLMPHYRCIAIIKAAYDATPSNRQLRALQISEMKAEHALNLAQRELGERPNDPAVNARVSRAIARYLPTLLDLRAECDARAARYTTSLVSSGVQLRVHS